MQQEATMTKPAPFTDTMTPEQAGRTARICSAAMMGEVIIFAGVAEILHRGSDIGGQLAPEAAKIVHGVFCTTMLLLVVAGFIVHRLIAAGKLLPATMRKSPQQQAFIAFLIPAALQNSAAVMAFVLFFLTGKPTDFHVWGGVVFAAMFVLYPGGRAWERVYASLNQRHEQTGPDGERH